MKTQQEIFTQVINHLRAQGRPAQNSTGRCRYLVDDGTKCAVGCLIDPEHYSPELEGKGVYASEVKRALEKSGVEPTVDMVDMLGFLQDAHDNEAVEEWERLWAVMAKRYALEVPEY